MIANNTPPAYTCSDARNELKPGLGNTRLIPEGDSGTKGIRCHLDYLRVRVTLSDVGRLHELLHGLFGKAYVIGYGSGWSAGKGAVRFDHRITGDFDSFGGFSFEVGDNETLDPASDDMAGIPVKAMIDLPGTFWEKFDAKNQWLHLVYLRAIGVECCRIDPAIDDYEYSLIPREEMRAATLDGNNMFFCIHNRYDSYNTRSKRHSITDYYGSRESGKMTRVYDHYFNENEKALRLETEFKRKYAKEVFNGLADLEPGGKSDVEFDREFQAAVGRYAVGAVDFRDKSLRQDKNKASRKDCPRLPFWQEFVDKIGGSIRIKLEPVVKTVEKTIKWVFRSVAPTIAALHQALPSLDRMDLIASLVKSGSDRASDIHKLIKRIGQEDPERLKLALCRN